MLLYYRRAGLFGSKFDLSMQILPVSGWQVPHCRYPLGEWHSSAADINPNHNHVNAAPKQASLQTTSRPLHHATPQANLLYVLVSNPALAT